MNEQARLARNRQAVQSIQTKTMQLIAKLRGEGLSKKEPALTPGGA